MKNVLNAIVSFFSKVKDLMFLVIGFFAGKKHEQIITENKALKKQAVRQDKLDKAIRNIKAEKKEMLKNYESAKNTNSIKPSSTGKLSRKKGSPSKPRKP